MQTVFDSEKWKIQAMGKAVRFAGCSNAVDVATGDGGNRRDVYIAVPTELFKYAKEVMKVEDMANVYLYLDRHDGRYVFGVKWVEGKSVMYHDLWSYSNMPKWAR